MKKELLFVLILSIIFSSISIHAATTGLVSPVNPGHNSSQIFIPDRGGYITLQNAIDSGYLLKANTSVVAITSLPVSTPYEFANQLLITYNGINMTLQKAIDNNVFNGGSMPPATNSIPPGGEYSAKINVNTTGNIMTFQDAINNNKLSSACIINMGQSCYPSGYTGTGADLRCISQGTLACYGTCIGYTFTSSGTACHCITPKCVCAFGDTACIQSGRCNTKCDTTNTCNGAGYCR